MCAAEQSLGAVYNYPCEGCVCCRDLECSSVRPPGVTPCDHETCACWAG